MKYMTEAQWVKHEEINHKTNMEALGQYMFDLIKWYDENSSSKAEFTEKCNETLKGMIEYANSCRRNGVFK